MPPCNVVHRPASANLAWLRVSPPEPVASLAPIPEMGWAMRRQANVRAVGRRPRNLYASRMPSVLEYCEGNHGPCVRGQGGAHIRRGVRP